MSDRTVSFSELASEGLIEVGAGRPRSVLDQYPSIPILRVADVLDGRIESPSQDRVPDGYRKVVGSKISKPGDIVLTVKGTVGRVALMPSDGPVFAYSPQLCYFRPAASGPLRSRYLYYWFKSTQFWNQADALKGQTDMADYLSLSDIQALKIRIPSLDRQDGIIDSPWIPRRQDRRQRSDRRDVRTNLASFDVRRNFEMARIANLVSWRSCSSHRLPPRSTEDSRAWYNQIACPRRIRDDAWLEATPNLADSNVTSDRMARRLAGDVLVIDGVRTLGRVGAVGQVQDCVHSAIGT